MNLRNIEHKRNGHSIKRGNKWAENTKRKISNLISSYKGKRFTTSNLYNLQNDVGSLLRTETGLRILDIEAEVHSEGKIVFHASNEATKEILKELYVPQNINTQEEETVSTADADMADIQRNNS